MNRTQPIQKQTTEAAGLLWVKLGISVLIIALIILQIMKQLEITTETIALVIVAILPWLSSVIESIKLPGGTEVKFLHFARSTSEAEASEARVSIEDASVQLFRQIADLQDQVRILQEALPEGTVEFTTRPTIARSPEGAILWVDDHPEKNDFEIARLKEFGYQIHEVTTTAKVLEYLQSGMQFSVIISDMGRYEENQFKPKAGLELIGHIRETGCKTPVIIYTSPAVAAREHDTVKASSGENDATGSPVELFQIVQRRMST